MAMRALLFGSITPRIETFTMLWSGGQRVGMLGRAFVEIGASLRLETVTVAKSLELSPNPSFTISWNFNVEPSAVVKGAVKFGYAVSASLKTTAGPAVCTHE